MPLTIIMIDILDVLGVDFIGLLPNSFENKYIFLCVDYVSKWLKIIPIRTNETRVVFRFLCENIITYYGMSHAIISDYGTHFGNRCSDAFLKKLFHSPLIYHPLPSLVKWVS